MLSHIDITQTIVLFRHARAYKNEQNRHGGNGSELVESAINEIQFATIQLRRHSTKFDNILYSPRTQCERTAKILGEQLHIGTTELQLEPINLGIVDGLSDEEVTKTYPELAVLLTKWRSGDIEINQLKVPQMTDCHDFYNRGKVFIESLINSKKSVIIVASRSILVLLMNVLLGRNSRIGGNYREVKWGNAEFAVFTNSDIGKSLHLDISTLKI